LSRNDFVHSFWFSVNAEDILGTVRENERNIIFVRHFVLIRVTLKVKQLRHATVHSYCSVLLLIPLLLGRKKFEGEL